MKRTEFLASKLLDENITGEEMEELNRDSSSGEIINKYKMLEEKGREYYNGINPVLPSLSERFFEKRKNKLFYQRISINLNRGYIKAAAVLLLFLLALISFNNAERYREHINKRIEGLLNNSSVTGGGLMVNDINIKKKEIKEILSASFR